MNARTQTFYRLKLNSFFQLLSFLCISLLCAAPVWSEDLFVKLDILEITNLHAPEQNIYASGQPSKESYTGIAEAGIQVVVNLRPHSEQDWNEQAVVESSGMSYINLPIAGADGITMENARQLSDILAKLEGKQVLVHCSSGNRVGALRAFRSFELNNGNLEAAIEDGKKWGLTRLESVVREKLNP